MGVSSTTFVGLTTLVLTIRCERLGVSRVCETETAVEMRLEGLQVGESLVTCWMTGLVRL